MKKRLLIILFILSFSISFSQKSDIFLTNVKGIDQRIDSLPCFFYQKSELDSFLIHNLILPLQYDRSMSVHVYVSFYVDSTSKTYNINVSKVDIKLTDPLYEANEIDSITAYYKKETTRLISLTNDLWLANASNSNKQLNLIIPFVSKTYEQKKRESRESKAYYTAAKKDDEYYKNLEKAKKTYKINNYYDYGVQKLNEKKYLIAKKYFEQAIALKNNDIDSYYNLGICYLKLNDSSRACKCWKTGQKLGDTGVTDLINKYCK